LEVPQGVGGSSAGGLSARVVATATAAMMETTAMAAATERPVRLFEDSCMVAFLSTRGTPATYEGHLRAR
jgi:hypothetical protein